MATMKTIEARVNRITLNRGADLFYWGENVFLPFGNSSAKDLSEKLESIGAEVIEVEYRTNEKHSASNLKTFTKRVEMLDDYDRTDWAPRVIRGFVHEDTMVCTLTRKEG